MGIKENVLALAEELDGVSLKDDCESCLASGTSLCRGDLECAESAHKACAKRLRAIVERDAEDVTTVSAYDLLPEDEREAIAWVREQGGLDEVKRQRRDSVPRAAYERNLAKRQRQVDESHAALRRRNRWIAELEHLLCKEMSYSLRRDAGCLAPEALDADGVEIREGDTVWHVETGEQCKVVEVDSRSVSVDFRVDGDGAKHTGSILPANLTHERPDTWERLEHDAEKTVCEYFGANYDCANCPLESARCAEEVKKDIIRRAKKLAERGA